MMEQQGKASETETSGSGTCSVTVQTAATINICPTVEAIMDSRLGILCPVDGCPRVTTRHSSMGSHLRSHHKHGIQVGTPIQIRYYCPSTQPCSYFGKNGKPRSFSSMKFLRQHYLKVHSPKEFVCPNCAKCFGSKSFLKTHLRTCGISFNCSCSKSFSSLASLQTHARRRAHSFDIQKYRSFLLTVKKKEEQEKDPGQPEINQDQKEPPPPKNVNSEEPSPKNVKSMSPPNVRSPLTPVPIQPKPTTSRDGSQLFLLVLKDPRPSVDIGTQTTPLLVRKRSTTRHCQTEYKSTATTGTLTVATTTTVDKQLKRKTSAQTQTKKLKISSETQTPVVTKRKRSIGKKPITTATTQTPRRALQPLNPNQEQNVSVESHPHSPLILVNMFESFDEVHSETQTEPNPFFGYPNSSHRAHLDVFLSDDSEELEEGDGESGMRSKLKTIETQTLPSRKMMGRNNQPNSPSEPLEDGNYFSCASREGPTDGANRFSLTLQPPSMGEDGLGYLETMDNETQTNFFDSTPFNFMY